MLKAGHFRVSKTSLFTLTERQMQNPLHGNEFIWIKREDYSDMKVFAFTLVLREWLGGGGVKTFLHSIGRFEDERRFIVFTECNCL